MTAALILAAGTGSRFAGPTPKLLARIGGQPLVRLACESALAAGLAGPFVVTGSVDLGAALPPGVIEVPNPRWHDGLASSLAVGITAAREQGHDAVVVALGDQPFLTPDAWRAVAGATATPIAAATYDGERGHPVRLASAVWDLLPTHGEKGAGPLMASRPELVTEVPCTSGTSADIDTERDLDQFS